MENIWTSFRKELGFVTASIQYVELALRIAKSEKEKELSENLQAIAKQHKLYVSIIPEDISIRIAKNYIIQIHSCIERFLYDYHRLKGSATHNLKYDKEKDNFLHWTMEHALECVHIKIASKIIASCITAINIMSSLS